MELDETLAFVTVLGAGSFTAAAKRLDVPKSTLSRRVSRLEERLGARLLHRTTRRISPTETGRAYFERCHAAIEEIRDAQRLAQDVSGVPKGTLRVTCPFDLARDHLAPLLPEFRARYPEIDLFFFMSQKRVDIVAEGFDVSLRGGAMADSAFVSRKISGGDLILCASPDYLQRRGCPASVAELADHDIVTMPFPGNSIPFDGPDGKVPITFEPWLVANEWGFLRKALLDGLGIGPNLIQTVRNDLDEGRLERVLPQLSIGGGGVYAVYPSRHHLSPKVRVFVDYLVDTLGVTMSQLASTGAPDSDQTVSTAPG